MTLAGTLQPLAMKLYDELTSIYPFVSAPEEYEGEATSIAGLLDATATQPPRDVLELGSGAGHLASRLRERYAMTLTDLSPAMLALSRALNPQWEHVEGDMRTLRLGRTFDAVIVHDAVVYMTTELDLRAAIETAAVHCRAGGAVVFAPDYTAESFEAGSETGGRDDPDGRSVRFLSWTVDPDPTDTTYEVDYAFLVRERGEVRALHDHHVEGIFPRSTWLRLTADAGFAARIVVDEWRRDLIVARRAVRS